MCGEGLERREKEGRKESKGGDGERVWVGKPWWEERKMFFRSAVNLTLSSPSRKHLAHNLSQFTLGKMQSGARYGRWQDIISCLSKEDSGWGRGGEENHWLVPLLKMSEFQTNRAHLAFHNRIFHLFGLGFIWFVIWNSQSFWMLGKQICSPRLVLFCVHQYPTELSCWGCSSVV